MTEEMCEAADQEEVLASGCGCMVYFYFYVFQGNEKERTG